MADAAARSVAECLPFEKTGIHSRRELLAKLATPAEEAMAAG